MGKVGPCEFFAALRSVGNLRRTSGNAGRRRLPSSRIPRETMTSPSAGSGTVWREYRGYSIVTIGAIISAAYTKSRARARARKRIRRSTRTGTNASRVRTFASGPYLAATWRLHPTDTCDDYRFLCRIVINIRRDGLGSVP